MGAGTSAREVVCTKWGDSNTFRTHSLLRRTRRLMKSQKASDYHDLAADEHQRCDVEVEQPQSGGRTRKQQQFEG